MLVRRYGFVFRFRRPIVTRDRYDPTVVSGELSFENPAVPAETLLRKRTGTRVPSAQNCHRATVYP